jgi:drug/metabolite transporter (DMT)-like permease
MPDGPGATKRSAVPAPLLLTLSSLFWSGNWIVGRALRDAVPPIGLSFWRWSLATLILVPFAWRHVAAGAPAIRRAWRPLLFLGVSGTAVFNAMCYYGVHFTTATNGLLLQSALPVMVMILTRVVFGQKLAPVQIVGAAISLCGVLAIVTRGDPAALASLSLNRGDAWVLAALVLWAGYTVCLRYRPADVHPLGFLFVIAAVGAAATAPGYAWEIASGAAHRIDVGVALGLCYVALFPSVLAYVCWNSALRRMAPERASLFLHLMPIFGSAMSIAFLGERLHVYHIAGMALILSGIALVTRLRAERRPAG